MQCCWKPLQLLLQVPAWPASPNVVKFSYANQSELEILHRWISFYALEHSCRQNDVSRLWQYCISLVVLLAVLKLLTVCLLINTPLSDQKSNFASPPCESPGSVLHCISSRREYTPQWWLRKVKRYWHMYSSQCFLHAPQCICINTVHLSVNWYKITSCSMHMAPANAC